MNEMVDRVAEALSAELSAAVERPPYNPEGDKWWDSVLRLAARAAIAAMREPTDAMDQQGGAVITAWFKRIDFYPAVPPEISDDVWPAMIDAALADP